MRIILYVALILLSQPLSAQESIIEDLRTEVANLENGQGLILEYTFEGCFGPYHHGNVSFSFDGGVLEYISKSFDHKNQPGIAQAGSYDKTDLVRQLRKALNDRSSKVYGNAITYRLIRDGKEVVRGADEIEQRHFIKLFEPFTSVFPKQEKDIVPKISSGGFVH